MEQHKTKRILLTRGKFALIDARDFKRVSKYKWFCDFADYPARDIRVGEKHKRVWLHRWLMGAKRGELVDHINRNPLDNRRDNLRVCDTAQNCRNSKMPISNKSGYKGVSFHKSKQKFRAYIKVNRKQIFLGYYDDTKDAARAYNDAAVKYFGEFACLNNL